ncbi:hypothetical protein L3Q82_013397 [Scortum barcoo]|uniref:Uncharacterized protein n=1 Tax=Scortum barcoo TaxID=214431 RepID=A0ACB8VZP3_9TELE|nr:hypothetical protein L3Q82_013397 [Scortum barcoo]
MRLYLAVAVLMLAFVAYTEAQEETIEEKFNKFGEQVAAVGRDIAEKAKTGFESFQNSEFYTTSRNWFQEQMHKKELLFSLILLMEACGLLLAQSPSPAPAQPDPPGILQRLAEKARETKAKVQDLGGVAWGFLDAYYEDHIQPVTDSYTKWASDVKSSVWETILSRIENYMSSD